jgi:ABC-type multidrug transport system ATPase subunit
MNQVALIGHMGNPGLYSSRVLEVTEKTCTKVIILNKGRIVAYNFAADLGALMKLPTDSRSL